MGTRTNRLQLLRRLLQRVQQAGLDPSEEDGVREQIAWTLSSDVVCVEGGGFELTARITEQLALEVAVRGRSELTGGGEDELFEALRAQRSIVAALVLQSWPAVRALCERRSEAQPLPALAPANVNAARVGPGLARARTRRPAAE